MSNTSTLAGKAALVTGASRGIGAAIARRLAADGAAVAITYSASPEKAQEVVKSIEAAGGKAIAIQADAADAVAVRAAVARAATELGGLDILVNNAGVAIMAPLADLSEADFDKTFAINVKALFVASQEAANYLPQGGRIIHIGSVNSDSAPFPGLSAYSMSKGAVAGMNRAMARDLGPRGITVNNIQPGPVDTDLNPATGPFADTLRGLMALGRYGSGEEIAGLVSYLVGPEGSYVTGANLKIDGGFDV
ncbi:SDR family oxidoreductase [Haloferula sp. BvORR071]|uniref:SDR family oxidoreductase n=1 Tax=Haloferula sp. BvORR071 TaxID=1396141 RepID=UPI000558C457|nr:SDR family oxidoreductase [Haloferula sp. BvORR071]